MFVYHGSYCADRCCSFIASSVYIHLNMILFIYHLVMICRYEEFPGFYSVGENLLFFSILVRKNDDIVFAAQYRLHLCVDCVRKGLVADSRDVKKLIFRNYIKFIIKHRFVINCKYCFSVRIIFMINVCHVVCSLRNLWYVCQRKSFTGIWRLTQTVKVKSPAMRSFL